MAGSWRWRLVAWLGLVVELVLVAGGIVTIVLGAVKADEATVLGGTAFAVAGLCVSYSWVKPAIRRVDQC